MLAVFDGHRYSTQFPPVPRDSARQCFEAVNVKEVNPSVLADEAEQQKVPSCACRESVPVAPAPVAAPPGRTEWGFSGITGKALPFYTPEPFDVLLKQCSLLPPRDRQDGASEDRPITPLLLRAIAQKRDGTVDVAQARRLFDAAMRKRSFEQIDEFAAIGKSISSRVTGFRSEIGFAGGKTSSQANQIFSPPAAIPALMESLRAEIAQTHFVIDATSFAAIVGFYCIHVHPFVDGNGRWTRIIAITAGAIQGDPVSAALNAAFLTSCSAELIHGVWPSSKVTDLGRYLELSHDFDHNVRSSPDWLELVDSFASFDQKLRRLLRNRSQYSSVARELYTASVVPLEKVRQQAGVSRRVIDGLLEADATGRNAACLESGAVSLRATFDRVTKVIDCAKHRIFNGDAAK